MEATENRQKVLEWVARYMRCGFAITPIRMDENRPCTKDGEIAIYAGVGQHNIDEALRDFRTRYPDNVGVGIVTGHRAGSNMSARQIVCVDIDRKHGKDGLEALRKAGIELPDTLTSVSPSGGEHRFYFTRRPVKTGTDVEVEGADGGDVVLEGVDIKGNTGGKGISVATVYPSRKANGGYEWNCGEEGFTDLAANAPLVKEFPYEDFKRIEKQFAPVALDSRTASAVAMPRRLELAREWIRDRAGYAVDGQGRHKARYAAMCALVGGFLLDGDALWTAAREWNEQKCCPPVDERELQRSMKGAIETADRTGWGLRKEVKGMEEKQKNAALEVEDCSDTEAMLLRALASPVHAPKISTGFRALDSVLSGRTIGVQPHEMEIDAGGMVAHGLYVLAGGTGQGKTALALQLARTVAQGGKGVLYASLEMSTEELKARLTAAVANERLERQGVSEFIQQGDVFDGARMAAICAGTKGVRESVIEAAREVSGLPLKFIKGDIRDMGSQVIVDTADAVGCDLLVVDYLQILSPEEDRHEDDMQMLRRSTADLKNWAKASGKTVLLLSSINRANYSTRQGNDALKGSGDIEYGADGVLMLDFEWPVTATKALCKLDCVKGGNGATAMSRAGELVREYLGTLADRPVAIRVTKNRHNPKGVQHTCFHAARMTFDALPGEFHGGMTVDNWTSGIIEGVCGMVGEELKEEEAQPEQKKGRSW